MTYHIPIKQQLEMVFQNHVEVTDNALIVREALRDHILEVCRRYHSNPHDILVLALDSYDREIKDRTERHEQAKKGLVLISFYRKKASNEKTP